MFNSKEFDYSAIKDQAMSPFLQWLSALTEEQKKAFVSAPTVASDDEGRKLVAIEWTTSARFACNRGKSRVDNVWEQYVNPDNQPIPLNFAPKVGAAPGTEFVSDGPAEKFAHDFTYRSIGTVTINGTKHAAFVSTVIRTEIGNEANTTQGHELVIAIGDGKMLSLYLGNDGVSNDLPSEFKEARMLERSDIAKAKVKASVQKALDGHLDPERRAHLERVKTQYEHSPKPAA